MGFIHCTFTSQGGGLLKSAILKIENLLALHTAYNDFVQAIINKLDCGMQFFYVRRHYLGIFSFLWNAVFLCQAPLFRYFLISVDPW